MSDLPVEISKKDYQSLRLAIHGFTLSASPTRDELISIIHSFPLLVENFPEVFPPVVINSRNKNETLVRFRYETLIWAIGEAFRHVVQRNRTLRKDIDLYKEIEVTTLNKAYGTGRESFVMLLTLFGQFVSIQLLKALLADQDTIGHAVYTARKLKIAEIQEDIRPFLSSKVTWIRNEAKKYFSNIQKNIIVTT